MQVQGDAKRTGYRYSTLPNMLVVVMSVTTLLRAAAAAGDAVTLTYDDGVNPEVLRIVMPVAVHGEYLEAIVDPAENTRKLIKLSKIASVRCAGGRFALNATARSSSAERAFI